MADSSWIHPNKHKRFGMSFPASHQGSGEWAHRDTARFVPCQPCVFWSRAHGQLCSRSLWGSSGIPENSLLACKFKAKFKTTSKHIVACTFLIGSH